MSDLNDRNVEQLSAYLDGELTEAERATLEARLQADPALRGELDSLRQTVALVRALPTLKAPRSFALTAEQAGLVARPRPLPFYVSSAFSALSAAAAVALVALSAYLLLGMQPALAPAPAALMMEVAAAPTVPLPSARMGITPLPTLAPASVQGADTYDTARAVAAPSQAADDEGDTGQADMTFSAPPALEAAPAAGAAAAEAPAQAQPTMTLVFQEALQDAAVEEAVDEAEAPLPAPLPAGTATPAPTPAPPAAPGEAVPVDTQPLPAEVSAVALLAGGLALLLLAVVTTLARRRLSRL